MLIDGFWAANVKKEKTIMPTFSTKLVSTGVNTFDHYSSVIFPGVGVFYFYLISIEINNIFCF